MILLLSACSQERGTGLHEEQIFAFGTIITLTTWDADPAIVEQAAAILTQDFAYMHQAWHAWRPGALARVNGLLQSGETFVINPSILPLIEKSMQLSIKSHELFNPAIGKLVAMWGFHADTPEGQIPDAQAIAELVAQKPSMRDIRIDGINATCSNPAVHLDFGAFAKGYGIDQVVTKLKQLGIKNAILNAGGDLRAFGSKRQQPWRIGIQHPFAEGAIASIAIQNDESVYTSGNYERNYESKGRRVHHIIDPFTGQPAEGTASVTVIHNDGATADAAATALFIAGPSRWLRVAADMGLSQVMLVESSGAVHMTRAMADRLQFEIDPVPAVTVHDLPPATSLKP